MNEVRLQIYTATDSQFVTLNGKLSVGRTTQADLALNDGGLSRVHATFERHDDEIWLFDENSTNGTFVNGAEVPPDGVKLNNGDEVKIGYETQIVVQISRQSSVVSHQSSKSATNNGQPTADKNQKSKIKNQSSPLPPALLWAGGGAFVIIGLTIAVLVGLRLYDNNQARNSQPKPKTPISADIPVALVDPLKDDERMDNIDEFMSFLEVQEEIDATQIDDVKAKPTTAGEAKEEAENLNVTRAFWEQQKAKALAPRSGATGILPPGMQPPRELAGDGVVKQKQKLAEMLRGGYQQPMDFSELAQKRMNKELLELPMATNEFYLEVGSSATDDPFTSFDFDNGSQTLPAGSPKLETLKKLATNFAGQTYNIEDGRSRQQMKVRLLRMFHPLALPVLKRLGAAYSGKFNRPLRVTSLARSMEYQIALNKVNPNSFKVRGAGSLPPHTSGCAFDLGRKHMTAEEQNFVMAELAKMENEGILDALIEYNANACFHVFIYPDGKPPK